MLILQFTILHFCPNFRICSELADSTAACMNAATQTYAEHCRAGAKQGMAQLSVK